KTGTPPVRSPVPTVAAPATTIPLFKNARRFLRLSTSFIEHSFVVRAQYGAGCAYAWEASSGSHARSREKTPKKLQPVTQEKHDKIVRKNRTSSARDDRSNKNISKECIVSFDILIDAVSRRVVLHP